MASVMNTHRFEGIRYEFVPGGEIVPYLAPHESRRLFGGAEGPVHSHTHEQYVAVDDETGADVRASAGARALASAPAPASADRRRAAQMTAADDGAAGAGHCGAPRPHAAVRGLDVPDRRLRVLGRARIGDPEARGDRRGHAARVRAHRGRAGRARATASRSSGRIAPRPRGDVAELDADRRAGLRPQALGRDADDVGAHGQEVRRDGRRGDRRAAAARRGASASTPATRPAAIRWRWR